MEKYSVYSHHRSIVSIFVYFEIQILFYIKSESFLAHCLIPWEITKLYFMFYRIFFIRINQIIIYDVFLYDMFNIFIIFTTFG